MSADYFRGTCKRLGPRCKKHEKVRPMRQMSRVPKKMGGAEAKQDWEGTSRGGISLLEGWERSTTAKGTET